MAGSVGYEFHLCEFAQSDRLCGDWCQPVYPAVTGGGFDISLAQRLPNIVQPVSIFKGEVGRPALVGDDHLDDYFGKIFALAYQSGHLSTCHDREMLLERK